MRGLFLSLFISFFITVTFQNCAPAEFDAQYTTQSSNGSLGDPDPNNPNDPNDPNCEKDCFEESFTQPSAAEERKLDLLFVLDTSGSLYGEKTAIVNGITNYIDSLPQNTNLRMAVLLAHAKSSYAGKLFKGNSNAVIDFTQTSNSDAESDLRSKFNSAPEESYTDGGEVGLAALINLTSGSNLAAAKSEGFFREGAELAVIFVSDENDICAEYPQGVPPVADPQRNEVARQKDYCGSNKDQVAAAAHLSQTFSSKTIIASSIIYTGEHAFSQTAENEIGYGYLEFTKSFDGFLIDIALGSAGIADGLKGLGDFTKKKLELKDQFLLSRPGAASDVKVYIDGVEVDFEYNDIIHGIQLKADKGQAGSEVLIEYCVPKTM